MIKPASSGLRANRLNSQQRIPLAFLALIRLIMSLKTFLLFGSFADFDSFSVATILSENLSAISFMASSCDAKLKTCRSSMVDLRL